MFRRIVGIDIGSSKISCVVARHNFEKDIKILGSYTGKSSGMSNGTISNIALLEKSILLTVENTEKIIRDTISKVSINISGCDLDYITAEVSAGISQKPITKKDIAKLLSSVVINVPNAKILHTIPVYYTVDDIAGVRNPIGMVCTSLKLVATVIYVKKSLYKNLLLAFERCNIKVEEVVADPYAAAFGSLTEDEFKLGTALIDLGSSLSSIAFFKDSSLQFIKSIAVGGANITKDIAYAFDIDFNSAERLKILYGSATNFISNAKEFVLVQSTENKNLVNLKQVQKSEIFAVINPRVVEILEMINHHLLAMKPRSIVITGGGAMLSGMIDVAEQVFKVKVRHHKRQDDYSQSAIGIVNFVYNDDTVKSQKPIHSGKVGNNGLVKKIVNWLVDNF